MYSVYMRMGMNKTICARMIYIYIYIYVYIYMQQRVK